MLFSDDPDFVNHAANSSIPEFLNPSISKFA